MLPHEVEMVEQVYCRKKFVLQLSCDNFHIGRQKLLNYVTQPEIVQIVQEITQLRAVQWLLLECCVFIVTC
jgi:hypothetical protein